MRRFVLIVGVLTIVFGMFWGIRAWTTVRLNARAASLNVDVENLFVGLQRYKEYVGRYPAGSNPQIVKALMGENPKNVIILVGRKNDLNSQGELVDPWGTALRIYFAGEGILIRSAGPNKRFDDSTTVEADDYYRSN
jgi:hypothetical protein